MFSTHSRQKDYLLEPPTTFRLIKGSPYRVDNGGLWDGRVDSQLKSTTDMTSQGIPPLEHHFGGMELMIKGTTAASNVVITPAAAMKIRRNLMKDNRKRRILRPALNLTPLKDDSDVSVRNRKVLEKKEDRMQSITDEVKAERRRRTYSPERPASRLLLLFVVNERIKY